MGYFRINYRTFVVLFILIIVVTLPKWCYSQERSQATYYGSPDCKGTPRGACGYDEYGINVNDGNVAAVSRLYDNGAGCGACYKMKCMESECNEDGVTVVVTDYGESDDADFILSGQAFAEMAESEMDEDLKAYGKVNIEYERVPCQYPSKNLLLKVHEHSHYPNYLALVLYDQAGTYDITSLAIFEEATQKWRACRRAYGAVWDMANPPKRGGLTVRFLTRAGANGEVKWVLVPNVIPRVWTAGAVYDTNLQLT